MRDSSFLNMRRKITLLISVFLVILISIIGGSVYYQLRQMVTKTLGEEALSVAERAVSIIDPTQYKDLVENGDANSPYYVELREKLSDFREKTGLAYLYTMQIVDGKYTYIVDGMPVDSDTYSAFGTVEDPKNISPKMILTTQGKTVLGDLVKTKDWGRLLSAYCPIKGPDGEILGFIGADKKADSVYKLLLNTLTSILIMLCVLLLVAAGGSYFVARSLARPLEKLAMASGRVSEGDLTVELGQDRHGNEIGRLYQSFGTMVEHLRSIIQTLQKRYDRLTSGVQVLEQTASSTEHSMGMISESMATVAQGSEEQVGNLSSAVDNVMQLLDHIAEIEHSSSRVLDLSSEAESRAQEGRRVLDVAKNQIAQIDRKASNSADSIRTLSSKINDITGFIQVISGIAKQTNLLALNAAIESARAGEEGRGFAVVAKEIRELAEESTTAATEVVKTVNEIYSTSESTVQVISEMVEEVQSGVRAINDADRQFENVLTTNHSVNENIARAASKLKSITSAFHEIKEGLHGVSAVAEEASATTEEVAALIAHEQANIQKIKQESDELVQLAAAIKLEIEKFKL